MANIQVRVVDTQDSNTPVELNELTGNTLATLIFQTEELLEELNEKFTQDSPKFDPKLEVTAEDAHPQ